MVFTTLTRLASKRIPLIKFRKGGNVSGSAPSATAPAGSAKAAPARAAAAPMAHKAVSGPAIEDWQLPAKYRRRPIDPTEIDYINRGGPP